MGLYHKTHLGSSSSCYSKSPRLVRNTQEHLGGKTFLDGDGGQVDSVLSPHMEDIMKPSKLWKKERVGLLLLISENPRPTNSDQHDPSYQYETGGASLYNHS